MNTKLDEAATKAYMSMHPVMDIRVLFKLGHKYALTEDETVKALVEALSWFQIHWGTSINELRHEGYKVADKALAQFEARLKELEK